MGVPIKDLCCRHGFSEASFHLWRSKYGGLEVPDAKRLKALETENAKRGDHDVPARMQPAVFGKATCRTPQASPRRAD